MTKLVLLRHGESTWNKENRFTGWTDVDLSEKGNQEAHDGGLVLKAEGYTFDVAYTSVLKRAIRTLWIVLDFYLGSANYRNNLLRIGWSEADLETPGSDALFEAIVAWGDLDRIEEKVRKRFTAGADQVVLNLVAADPSGPPLAELRALTPLTRGG